MKKILFFIPTLECGGSERVIVHLMNHLDRDRFSVHLALLRKRGAFLEDIKGDIAVHELASDIAGAFLRVPPYIERIRPDIVLSSICYMNMVVGITRPFVRASRALFLARESGMPSMRVRNVRSVWNADWLYRLAYGRIDAVICQSNAMRDDVHERYRVPLGKIVTINNPVDVEAIRIRSNEKIADAFRPEAINLVAVGRLNPLKGFDKLLRALKSARNERLHLHIVGDGEEGAFLRKYAGDLGIAERVTFHGFKRNPYPYMRAADLFVLSSIYEGFPNVVLEALSLGCPVLAFDCPGGTRELVEDGVNGRLVPAGDVDALAREMDRAVEIDFDRGRIAEKANSRYRLEMIVKKYEELFERGEPAVEPPRRRG